MWGHVGNMHPPTPYLYEKHDVIGHQPTRRPDFRGKEIGADQEVLVGANKFSPRRNLFSLRSRQGIVTLQDIANRLVAHRLADIL